VLLSLRVLNLLGVFWLLLRLLPLPLLVLILWVRRLLWVLELLWALKLLEVFWLFLPLRLLLLAVSIRQSLWALRLLVLLLVVVPEGLLLVLVPVLLLVLVLSLVFSSMTALFYRGDLLLSPLPVRPSTTFS
jgi:hypothetical protein